MTAVSTSCFSTHTPLKKTFLRTFGYSINSTLVNLNFFSCKISYPIVEKKKKVFFSLASLYFTLLSLYNFDGTRQVKKRYRALKLFIFSFNFESIRSLFFDCGQLSKPTKAASSFSSNLVLQHEAQPPEYERNLF